MGELDEHYILKTEEGTFSIFLLFTVEEFDFASKNF